MSFGSEVRGFRKRTELGLRDFARMLKVSPSYLSMVESGKLVPTEEKIEVFARKMGVDRAELVLKAGRIPRELAPVLEGQPRGAALVLRAIKGMTDIEAERIVLEAAKPLSHG